MAGILDGLMQQLNSASLDKVSGALGTDAATTGSAVSAALPVLIAALAKNAATPQGASALAGALDRDHDGSALDSIGSLLGGGAGNVAGEKILGHVLGGQTGSISQALGAATGLNSAKTTQLLAMLAPVVLAYLGRQKREQGLDAGGLGSMLGSAQQSLPANSGMLGSVMSMLDRDKDGSVVDDVGGMVGKMFGR